MSMSQNSFIESIKESTQKAPEEIRDHLQQAGLLNEGSDINQITQWLHDKYNLAKEQAEKMIEWLKNKGDLR